MLLSISMFKVIYVRAACVCVCDIQDVLISITASLWSSSRSFEISDAVGEVMDEPSSG